MAIVKSVSDGYIKKKYNLDIERKELKSKTESFHLMEKLIELLGIRSQFDGPDDEDDFDYDETSTVEVDVTALKSCLGQLIPSGVATGPEYGAVITKLNKEYHDTNYGNDLVNIIIKRKILVWETDQQVLHRLKVAEHAERKRKEEEKLKALKEQEKINKKLVTLKIKAKAKIKKPLRKIKRTR